MASGACGPTGRARRASRWPLGALGGGGTAWRQRMHPGSRLGAGGWGGEGWRPGRWRRGTHPASPRPRSRPAPGRLGEQRPARPSCCSCGGIWGARGATAGAPLLLAPAAPPPPAARSAPGEAAYKTLPSPRHGRAGGVAPKSGKLQEPRTTPPPPHHPPTLLSLLSTDATVGHPRLPTLVSPAEAHPLHGALFGWGTPCAPSPRQGWVRHAPATPAAA